MQTVQNRQLHKYSPNSSVRTPQFTIKKHSSHCWYMVAGLLLQIEDCLSLPLGTEVEIVGSVGKQIDSSERSPYLLNVSQIQITFEPIEAPWWHPKRIRAGLYQARARTSRQLRIILPPAEADLVFTMMFGGMSQLPEKIEDAIRHLGISYLMAASGMQVNLFVGWLLPFFASFSRRQQVIITGIALAVYSQLALDSPSILRAVGQHVVKDGSRLAKRQYHQGRALLLIACCLVLVTPVERWVALQLSLAAVVGLQYGQLFQIANVSSSVLNHRLPGRLKNIVMYIKQVLITSVSIQIWLLPLLFSYFDGVTLNALIAAVVVLWLIPSLFAVGLPLVVIAALVPTTIISHIQIVLSVLSWPLHVHATLLLTLIHQLQRLTLPTINATISPAVIVGWYVALFCSWWWLKKLRNQQFRHQSNFVLQRSL